MSHGASSGMTDIPLHTAGSSATSPLLEIARLAMHFGGIVALDDVTFSVADG